MSEEHPSFRFFRPILWENEDRDYPYSVGGSSIVIRIFDRLLLLTAGHCLQNKGYSINQIRVPFRLGSQAYMRIDLEARIRAKNPEQLSDDEFDVAFLRIIGPSCEAEPLEEGEYLTVEQFEPNPYHLPRQLSGFPTVLQRQNFESGSFGGDGITIGGIDDGPTPDAGCRFFKSIDLLNIPADGLSGGAVTSDVLGNLQLEGICVKGSRGGNLDFVRFVSIESLKPKLFEVYRLTGSRPA